MAAEWEFVLTLNDQLRPLRSPVEVQDVALRLLGTHLGVNRVNYGHVDGDDFVITRAYTSGVPRFPVRGPVSFFGNASIDACRRGETFIIEDIRTDVRFTDEERARLTSVGTRALVGVPLFKDGEWLATLGVHSVTPRTWSRNQIALIELTADRTWSAGERARAEEALGHSETRQAFLRRLNATIRPLAEPTRIVSETCHLLGTHLRADRVIYVHIDAEDATIVAQYVNELPPLSARFSWRELGRSRTAEILRGGTMSVNDTSLEPHAPEERAALQRAGIGAYIAPLLVKDGRLIGAFGIHSREPRVWAPDEIALCEEVADRIWATLEHRKADEELRANEERLAFLLRLNDALRPSNDATLVLETAARLLGEHIEAGRVGYAELEGDKYVIRAEYARGVQPLSERGPASGFGAALDDAYKRGDTVVVHDVESDPRFTEGEREIMRRRQIAAFIGVTLIKDGRMVAAFGANHPTPRVWTMAEARLVRDVAERTWDAAERARAESALREREQRLRLALTASGGGSWTWNLRTNDADWDESFRARFGFSADEPADFDTWMSHVHEEDRPRVIQTMHDVIATRQTWDNVYRFVRSDGTILWIQSLGRAERDHTGEVIRVAGLELDITERRRMEDVVRAHRDEQHHRELALLLETATQGIVSVDAQGKITTANRALETMFGWEEGALAGRSLEDLMPSTVRRRHELLRADYFSKPEPRLMGRGLTLVGQRKDGSSFPIEVNLNHVATDSGGRAIAFVTDISERQRTASALQERSRLLEVRTRQLQRMASALTLAEHHARERIAGTLHDGLQQLLLIVALNLDDVLKRGRENGVPPSERVLEAKHHLDEAIAAARSLHLELFPPVLQRSGLPAALTWLAKWTHDKYQLHVDVETDSRADCERREVRTLLFESVRELLFNAFKYARAAHVTVQSSLESDDRLAISVVDDGIGFDPGRLDDQVAAGRAGWGLFSIRERLSLLGGTVDIDSAPGRGTRVRLVAPRLSALDRNSSAPSIHQAPLSLSAIQEGNAGSGQALTVLIVDDHAAVRRTLRALLDDRPELCVVGEASNGLDAVTSAHALRPHVIIMDVAMPGMDGIEATARISAELPHVIVFALSMESGADTVHAMKQAGAAGFFVKEIDTQRLIDRLLSVHATRLNGGHAIS